jgi:hypothetical protein
VKPYRLRNIDRTREVLAHLIRGIASIPSGEDRALCVEVQGRRSCHPRRVLSASGLFRRTAGEVSLRNA